MRNDLIRRKKKEGFVINIRKSNLRKRGGEREGKGRASWSEIVKGGLGDRSRKTNQGIDRG